MIITKLMGGLGNQMFQYAAGRRLAHQHQTELKLDLTAYDSQHPDDTPRAYELGCFDVSSRIAKRNELPLPREGRVARLLGRTISGRNTLSTIREEGFPVNKSVLSAPDNSYLIGYWQSERYFQDIRPTLLKDFTIKTSPNKTNTATAKQIAGVNAVSLHVRRGDYVTNSNANQFHGLSPLEYYRRAIELVASKVKDPHFFVFSDDPQWCKDNLATGHPTTYVTNNDGDTGYEDMRLMTQCQHHIIANSSFSWWGAWLDDKPNKIVVAPERWFNDPAIDTKDIYGQGWTKV